MTLWSSLEFSARTHTRECCPEDLHKTPTQPTPEDLKPAEVPARDDPDPVRCLAPEFLVVVPEGRIFGVLGALKDPDSPKLTAIILF